MLCFAGFELDEQRAELRGPDGAPIKLRRKSFDLLLLLATNSGRIVDKPDLMAVVWPNVHVADDSLFQCIRELRVALGDDRRQLIKVIPGRGYMLDAEVTRPPQLEPVADAPTVLTREIMKPPIARLWRRPWAIAATIVRPHEKVLSISGDGGFLFSANELETAVRLNSHLVHMIWIDGHYDMVGTQERLKYGRTSGVDFGPVNYAKYAEAFGATAFQIDSPDQIAPTLKKAFDTPGPVLVGVHVDYRDNARLFEDVHEGSIL